MTDPELLTDRERLAVKVKRRYDHPIDRVWRAVTTSEDLAQWFPFEPEIELRPDGEVRYGGGLEGDEASGKVLEVNPPQYLEFTWGGDRIEFELHAEGEQTVFVLTYHFDRRADAASLASGWEACLAALRAVLAGESPSPDDPTAQRHEELAARFRLDEPEVTRTETGWHVRFERQLTCPAQTAWDLFFDTEPDTGEQRRAPGVGEEFRPAQAPEVLLGIVTEVEAPQKFSFKVAAEEPGDEVSLRLGEGTGNGARLFLEVRGTEDDDLEAAVDQWGNGAVAQIAREAARLATQTSGA